MGKKVQEATCSFQPSDFDGTFSSAVKLFSFNARQYPCPKTSKERQTALFETIARIHDLKIVIDSTQKHRFQVGFRTVWKNFIQFKHGAAFCATYMT